MQVSEIDFIILQYYIMTYMYITPGSVVFLNTYTGKIVINIPIMSFNF